MPPPLPLTYNAPCSLPLPKDWPQPESSGWQQLKNSNCLPAGSALITGAGDMCSCGIQHIVHAAPASMAQRGTLFDPTLPSVRSSVWCSLQLAVDNGRAHASRARVFPLTASKVTPKLRCRLSAQAYPWTRFQGATMAKEKTMWPRRLWRPSAILSLSRRGNRGWKWCL